MSENKTSQNLSIEQLQSTLNNLAFIHRKLSYTSFLPEEFAEADQALRMVINMAEKVHADIQGLAPKEEASTEVTHEVE